MNQTIGIIGLVVGVVFGILFLISVAVHASSFGRVTYTEKSELTK